MAAGNRSMLGFYNFATGMFIGLLLSLYFRQFRNPSSGRAVACKLSHQVISSANRLIRFVMLDR